MEDLGVLLKKWSQVWKKEWENNNDGAEYGECEMRTKMFRN